MRFFNRTGGLLAITLRSGASIAVGPMTWFDIPKHEVSSESLHDHLIKGHVFKAVVQEEDAVGKAPLTVSVVKIPATKEVEPIAAQPILKETTEISAKPSKSS